MILDGGIDTLDGAGGDDVLFGDAGDDSLSGGAGDDLLDGGLEQTLVGIGGPGHDICVSPATGDLTCEL